MIRKNRYIDAISQASGKAGRITGQLKQTEGRKTTLVANRVEPDLAERTERPERRGVPFSRVVESTLLRDLLCRG